MTLGKVRGAVLLGQPLRVTIPIQLDAGESPSALCLDAEVFYGDTRLDAQRVVVQSEPSPQGLSAIAYLTSTLHVDEPVVTVYLQAGCQTKSTRRFVLLAELATDNVAQTKLASSMTPPTVPVITAEPRTRTASDAQIAVAPQARKRPVPGVEAPQSALPRLQPAQKSIVVRPRLKLLPLDLTQDRDPSLKSSDEMLVGEGENLEKRAEAAALWKSLNATPQDILDADRRRASMESDLKGLKAITASNSQAVQELTHRLEIAESQRYANPLVYALVAILLISTLGLAYFLFKWKQGGLVTLPWWRADEALEARARTDLPRHGDEAVQSHKDDASSTVVAVQPLVTATPPVDRAPSLTEVDIDIDLHLDGPAQPQQHERAGETLMLPRTQAVDSAARASGHADFAHSMTTHLRAINTKEMLDIRQQAEFFLTLGQHDEALALLKDCVDGSDDSNPLVYLDLLKALHLLGRKVEFDHYRTDFNALFSGHVPVYAAFSQGGHGLEDYPEICESIEAFWPSEQAIDYIEKRLVRDADDGTQQTMDLEAFRDLLMLHGTASRIAAISESGLMPFMAAKSASSEVGAIYAPGLDDFGAHDKTQPVAVDGMDLGDLSVDLELPEQPGNLIDFDPADLSLPSLQLPRKP